MKTGSEDALEKMPSPCTAPPAPTVPKSMGSHIQLKNVLLLSYHKKLCCALIKTGNSTL